MKTKTLGDLLDYARKSRTRSRTTGQDVESAERGVDCLTPESVGRCLPQSQSVRRKASPPAVLSPSQETRHEPLPRTPRLAAFVSSTAALIVSS